MLPCQCLDSGSFRRIDKGQNLSISILPGPVILQRAGFRRVGIDEYYASRNRAGKRAGRNCHIPVVRG